MIMTLSMNARVGVEGDITEDEVLVVGESYVAQGGSLFLMVLSSMQDTEGSLIPGKFKSATQATLGNRSSEGESPFSRAAMMCR